MITPSAAPPSPPGQPGRVAVIGAGVAGATCARHLMDAGIDVTVVDKSRGVGGRLATRRAEWLTPRGEPIPARFDHGAPGFTVRSPQFLNAVEQARRDGLLTHWEPRMAPGSYRPLDDVGVWVPVPDMPAWCRHLLKGATVLTGRAADGLVHTPGGWRIDAGGEALCEGFDAVVIAIPPEQAASLLRAHRADWAQRALAMSMRPAWALMAVTDDDAAGEHWDVAWPPSGPLAWVLRNDAKPGRERVAGRAHWVVHAAADWSQTHLEAPPADVQVALQEALACWLGRQPVWHHVAVHRWRYASAPRSAAAADLCWWDASFRLGTCGDAWGGAGVEGAWTSGRAMASLLIDHRPGSQARGAVVSPSLAHPRSSP